VHTSRKVKQHLVKAKGQRVNTGEGCRGGIGVPVGLHKIFVHFEAFMHEPTTPSLPPPACIAHLGAILLHDYWTVYDSPSDLPFVCYTLYNIGNTNIV